MRIAIHAGHNPDGKVACGAVGYLKESTCNREIVKEFIKLADGVIGLVKDVTVNNGKSASEILRLVSLNSNGYNAELSISVHLNAYGDKNASGVEAYYYPGNETGKKLCEKFCERMKNGGYRNRGAKSSNSLYVLKHIKPTSVLLECGFVTSPEDSERYDSEFIANCIFTAVKEAYGIEDNPMIKSTIIYPADREKEIVKALEKFGATLEVD